MESQVRGPLIGYNELLDALTTEAQEKAIEEGAHWQKTPLRPSAAGECERALAYSLEDFWGIKKHEREVKEPEVVRLLDIGHSVEWHLINHIKKYLKELFEVKYQQQVLSFKYLASEKDPNRNQWIEGSIDFTLSNVEYKAVCDAKSKKEKYSSYMNSSWEEDSEKYSKLSSVKVLGPSAFYIDDIKKFLEEARDAFLAMNIYQINLYACNQFLTERGFDHCSLWYYNKNTSKLRELRFKPSIELANYVLEKFERVFKLVDSGRTEDSKKEFNLGSIKCAFCVHKKECWSDKDALKEFFKSLPPKAWPTDVSRLEEAAASELTTLYEKYVEVQDSEKMATNLEEDICNKLISLEVRKIRFNDGAVYEVKYYKTPREGFRLKKGKV